ncbi:universal stress protein [Rhodococcus sp. NPDC056960]|uniref:universal stress protein n=1 Tax=Rhodococcus sp. NPDC056960 TaxID=3345982 RepID=UPI00362BAF96
MTIIAGFSASRQSSAPLHLATQLARTTGEKIVAAAIVERGLPPGVDTIEDQFQRHIAGEAATSLERTIDAVRGDRDISMVIHHSTSIPRGLMELVDKHDATSVVVGSSSAGLLGRVALGSVTERLVHTAAVPVAIAPRGYCPSSTPIQRLTAAYGGAADSVGLITTSVELAERWNARLRIAAFTVRPYSMFGGSIDRSAEDLIIRQWRRRTADRVMKQLSEAGAQASVPNLDLEVGAGNDWREAIDTVSWRSGDMLLLGSGAAGPRAHVFLGSAAAKILRHMSVPVMIVPKRTSTRRSGNRSLGPDWDDPGQ